MNELLRRRLLDLAEQDQVHARAVYEASQNHEPHRGKFLFDIPKEEWLPAYFQSEEVLLGRVNALLEIIREHGWPGYSLVGEDGSRAAWVIAQHGGPDPSFQAECEAALGIAVAASEARPGQLAAIRDRIELDAGRVQLYGTHLEPDGGAWRAVRGLHDETGIDTRRRALGLKPWRDYLTDCMAGVSET